MRRALWMAGLLWMSPMTAFGLLLALFGGARFHSRTSHGVFNLVARRRGPIHWYMDRLGISAWTLGATITYFDAALVGDARLYRHELEHVLQTLRWGPLMPVAYLASSLWQLLRGRRLYRDNWFEVQARARERLPLPPPHRRAEQRDQP